jgi:hypothetical protein
MMFKLFKKRAVLMLLITLLWPALAGAQATGDPIKGNQPVISPVFQPVAIEDISKARMPYEHYAMQKELWRQKVENEPRNADAWLNYYKVSRVLSYKPGTRIVLSSEKAFLDDIVERMEKNIPRTFEYHYAKYVTGDHDLSLFDHLQKAYELQPGRAELYPELVSYYYVQGDYEKKKEFCKLWYESGDIAPSVYQYNRNMLASLEPGAVLLTNGDYDTYPAWILQEVEGLRTDVTVVNVTPLLHNDASAMQALSNEGLVMQPIAPCEDYDAARLKAFAQANPSRPFYFSLTLSRECRLPLKDLLYLTGLAFRFSEKPFENIPVLKYNFSDSISLSYLADDSTYDKKYVFNKATVHSLHLNYVMPLAVLYSVYKAEGDEEKAKQALDLARRLAKQGGKEDMLNNYLRTKQ